jgi:hypothetical protein
MTSSSGRWVLTTSDGGGERTDWQGFLETGEDDDPDGDGLVNLYEYALGGNPVVADNPGTRRPTLRWNGGQPVIEFTPARDGLDTRYYLEHSPIWSIGQPFPLHPCRGKEVYYNNFPCPLEKSPAGSRGSALSRGKIGQSATIRQKTGKIQMIWAVY